jgi:hypothetical protein
MTDFDRVDDWMAHHGILGMHWGVRKSESSSPSKKQTRKETRQARDKEIIAARLRQNKRVATVQKAAARTYLETTKKGQEAAEKAYERAEKILINNPDADTASKMTHGEKVLNGLAWGTFGALTIGSIAIAAKG